MIGTDTMIPFARRLLDGFYTTAGFGAALALVAILVLVTLQMVTRWLGILFPGGASYAGYAMATASFLGLAYTFSHNEHIRVSLFVERSGTWRRGLEIWCYTAGSVIALYFAWHAIQTPLLSYRINDISQGQDGTPLWIPQIAMAVGATLLAVALVDNLVQVLLGKGLGVDSPTVKVDGISDLLASPKARAAMFAAALLLLYAAVNAMTGFDRDATGLKIGIFLFVMFFLLGTGLLGRTRTDGRGLHGDDRFHPAQPRIVHGDHRLVECVQLDADVAAAVHLDGRDPYRTRLSEDMFKGLAPWLARFPGGLLHTNVVGCTVFAAVSGSSAATLMTVGKMSHSRTAQPRLSGVHDRGHARRGGDAGPDDSALADADRVWRQRAAKHYRALHGRRPAGPRAGGDVHGLHRALVRIAPAGCATARAAHRLQGRGAKLGSSHSGDRTHPDRDRVDVCRDRHGDRGGGLRCDRSAAACRGAGIADLATLVQSLLGATRTSAMIALILMGAAFLTLSMGFTGVPRALAAVHRVARTCRPSS